MNLVHRLRRRLEIHRTVRELEQLPDHVLLDIGVDRHNLARSVSRRLDARPLPTATPARDSRHVPAHAAPHPA